MTEGAGEVQSQPDQATGLSRAAPKLKSVSSPTDHEKSPERGLHEAPTYQRLAAIASAGGYPEVTAARIHAWAKAGLVGEVTAPDVNERLLAICAARRRTASRANVTVLLWTQGWTVDEDLLRRCVLTALPGRGLRRDDDKQLDRLDEVAVRKASRLLRIL